jgi:hypothetical protein
LVADCPLLHKLHGNSNSRRLLARLLQARPPRPRPSGVLIPT